MSFPGLKTQAVHLNQASGTSGVDSGTSVHTHGQMCQLHYVVIKLPCKQTKRQTACAQGQTGTRITSSDS